MNDYILYSLVILLVMTSGYLIKKIAEKYAENEIMANLLSVEKVLSGWAKEQALNGQDKRKKAIELVVNTVYPKLPSWIKMFVSKDRLVERIDKLYAKVLNFLDDGE